MNTPNKEWLAAAGLAKLLLNDMAVALSFIMPGAKVTAIFRDPSAPPDMPPLIVTSDDIRALMPILQKTVDDPGFADTMGSATEPFRFKGSSS